jgi:hypothetical protein
MCEMCALRGYNFRAGADAGGGIVANAPIHFATIPEIADYLVDGYFDWSGIPFSLGPRSWGDQNITVNLAEGDPRA